MPWWNHFTNALPLLPPFYISQSLAKDQALVVLPPIVALNVYFRAQRFLVWGSFHWQWQFVFNTELFSHHKAHLEAKNSNPNLNWSYTHVAVCSAFSATSQNPMSPLFFCEKPSSQVSLYFVFRIHVAVMAAVFIQWGTIFTSLGC